MKFVAICMFDCIPLVLVLKDVAKSISQGYGAGTILIDGYQNLPCSWTSLEQCAGKNNIIIRSEVELSDYAMADLVLKYKPTKKMKNF